MLDQLTLTYIICSIVAGAFLAWTYTKPGKKWLKNL